MLFQYLWENYLYSNYPPPLLWLHSYFVKTFISATCAFTQDSVFLIKWFIRTRFLVFFFNRFLVKFRSPQLWPDPTPGDHNLHKIESIHKLQLFGPVGFRNKIFKIFSIPTYFYEKIRLRIPLLLRGIFSKIFFNLFLWNNPPPLWPQPKPRGSWFEQLTEDASIQVTVFLTKWFVRRFKKNNNNNSELSSLLK